MGDVEFESIVPGLHRPLEEVADPTVAIGQRLGHTHRAALAHA
jgi:hypothetical protein